MSFNTLSKFALLLCLVVGLSACKSSEERAEEHYQSGVELLQKGDTDRALVEFRNVFELNGNHREARQLYARTVRELGRTKEAYSQYLRLVEQYPDDLEGRIALAEMAFDSRNWDEFERHATAAVGLAPETPEVKVLALALRYREAATTRDTAALRTELPQAEALASELPDNKMLQYLLIDGYVADNQPNAALKVVDKALAEDPENRVFNTVKLSLLGQIGDSAGQEKTLREIVQRFPDDEQAKATLLRFYISKKRLDDAEAFLRQIVDPANPADPYFGDLIRFLIQVRGPDAALAEIDSAIKTHPDSLLLHGMRAGIDFDQGRRDQAIAAIETLLKDAPDTADSRKLRISLAKMLLATGNEVGAREAVESVLSKDATNGDALKMRANWMIDGDDVDGAVAALRTVLDQAPKDAEAMTLMARAYSRSGNTELTREFLSLAVEASNSAPAESMRYAELLMRENRPQLAEETLLSALRVAPGNEALLTSLGKLYIVTKDQGRARQVVDTLRRLPAESAHKAADGLDVSVVAMQSGADAAIKELEGLAQNSADIDAKIALIRAQLASGDAAGAMKTAQDAAAAAPDNWQLRYVLATVKGATGDLDGAEADYRTLIQQQPDNGQIPTQLARVLVRKGQPDEAEKVIDTALEDAPNAPVLLWAKASMQEQSGDIDGAIAVYEKLYEQDSNSPVVANNLASMLSTYRTDEASIDRAYTIGRRLRGTTAPAAQDTYGWIMYLRGDKDEAVKYLEPAAKGLPQDPMVQYHLAKAYLAADRTEDALRQFEKTVSAAGEIDTRPQIEEARAEVTRLRGQADAAPQPPQANE